ncbi:MAG: protein-glutamate O-methyltransferase CheR [Bacteroidales bacterium]|nr:protein-glutamate O-methyltransferase CheR [Bacteroidales bacterium]
MKTHPAMTFTHHQISSLKLLMDTGLNSTDISSYDEQFLSKTLQKRMLEIHCANADDYLELIKQNAEEVGFFLNSLQIGYTEFFRNSLTFSVLEHIILPSLIQKKKDSKRKEIRIWSAACSGGQESYSLAMVMEELKNGDTKKFSYRIFSTDQNEALVQEARLGHYTQNALNNLSLKRINQWFTKKGDTYTVKPELKNNIDFSVFDLFSMELSCPPASIFGEFDIVVCANLLFYYKNEYRQAMLKKTGNCMAAGGYLVTGETERQILMDQNYTEAFPQSAIFLKK